MLRKFRKDGKDPLDLFSENPIFAADNNQQFQFIAVMSPKTKKAKNKKEDSSKLEDATSELVEDLQNESVQAAEPEPEPESGSDAYAHDSWDELLQKLLVAQSEIDEMKDGYIRARAEVENIQRRSQNEIVSARKFAIKGFANELLSVLDSLDQATKVEMDDSKSEAVVKMKEGLELTLKQFDKVMDKFGIAEIEADVGVKFDPERHQAISVVPTDEVEADHILNVMQKGFSLRDRLLRPAMVVIAKSSES